MNKKRLFMILSVVLFFACAVILLLFLKSGIPISTTSDIGVISVDKNNISKISLSNNNGETVLINIDNQWFFEDDTKLPVLQTKAVGIAYDVATIFAVEKVESGAKDLKMYGLDPAVSFVTVQLKNGNEYSLYTGNRLDNNKGYYLKTSVNNDIYIVDVGKGQNFKIGKSDLIDYDLSDVTRENIKSVTLYNAQNQLINIERYSVVDGQVEWVMTFPTNWPVSSAEFESKIIYPVVSLKADKFFDDKTHNTVEFIKNNAAYVGLTDKNGISKFFRMSPSYKGTVHLYADGQNYVAKVNSKISIVPEVKPTDVMSHKIKFNHLGDNVKVRALIHGTKIEKFDNYNFESLVIEEQLEGNNYADTSQYIEFYNDTDSITYKFYEYDAEHYAVSTDGNMFFSLKKSLLTQLLNK